jgi:hypothetical protein
MRRSLHHYRRRAPRERDGQGWVRQGLQGSAEQTKAGWAWQRLVGMAPQRTARLAGSGAAWLCSERQGFAWHGAAGWVRRRWSGQCIARQSKAGAARRGGALLVSAEQCSASRGWHGRARRCLGGVARRGVVSLGAAGKARRWARQALCCVAWQREAGRSVARRGWLGTARHGRAGSARRGPSRQAEPGNAKVARPSFWPA